MFGGDECLNDTYGINLLRHGLHPGTGIEAERPLRLVFSDHDAVEAHVDRPHAERQVIEPE